MRCGLCVKRGLFIAFAILGRRKVIVFAEMTVESPDRFVSAHQGNSGDLLVGAVEQSPRFFEPYRLKVVLKGHPRKGLNGLIEVRMIGVKASDKPGKPHFHIGKTAFKQKYLIYLFKKFTQSFFLSFYFHIGLL